MSDINLENAIDELIVLANAIGNRLDFVQGAGGNISIKIDDQKLIVKASGVKLKDLNKNNGFTLVNFFKVNQLIKKLANSTEIDDSQFNSDVINFAENIINMPTSRPSMEIGFHSLINKKYVIHSHPLYSLYF